MSDTNGAALPASGSEQCRQLVSHHFPVPNVVEKDMPASACDQILPCHPFSKGGVGSTAVDEKEVRFAQAAHQPAHGGRVSCQQTPHVVIDSCHKGDGSEILLQGGEEYLLRHAQGERASSERIAQIGLHRQMQHHLPIQLMGSNRLFPGIGGLWQKRVGDSPGQCQGLFAGMLAIAHVIDDQGDADRAITDSIRFGQARLRGLHQRDEESGYQPRGSHQSLSHSVIQPPPLRVKWLDP